MITLTDKEIEEKYKISHAIKDVNAILKDYNEDKIVESIRTVLPAGKDSSMLYMPCISLTQQVSIIKTVSIFPTNKNLPTTQGNILVTDLTDGAHKATMDASYLTRLRTGAMTAIATDKLSRDDAKTLGVIGTGNMAFEQVLGVVEVRDIQRIYLFNRTAEKAEAFKKRLEDFGIWADIEVIADVDELVKQSDIINCATQSKTPVYNGELLKEGTHVNGVGSFTHEMKEMDRAAIKRADHIYVDDMDGIKDEAGELIDAVEAGIISWDDIRGTLADIYDQGYLRQNNTDITIYKCVGAGYFDLAVAGGVMKMFA
ncbi:L-lysine cyclodeaminase [Jeotgalicoccus saudimassiliensis]|uniref:L-lysine cyclodeaminase n=1 Tax=Jeotgalicoccus saudimassiliensis TaxID=1461582 RepID=A0A078MDX1_9STAP|nr:NAD(P)-binding domain-containing protein [Jeotgalicoccus saudimassiliensis]CEA02936.1 L-lysine cyclodeaminase [Jeotgalicoccus saudimassiliensis]